MQALATIFLLGGLISSAVAGPCYANNCARAVTGTRLGSSHVAQASADCVSFLGGRVNITATAQTVTVTTTIINTLTIARRQADKAVKTIPAYASLACKNEADYSSACSCFGVIGTTLTLGYSNFTTTTTVTSTSTYSNGTAPSVPTSTPSCTADILNDPLNCGKCGRVCSSGECKHGACADNLCADNQTCQGGFKQCNDLSSTCFCFSDYTGAGFCGQNAVCAGIDSCATDLDCATGSICATKTCCPPPSPQKPGICLVGDCINPDAILIRLSKMNERKSEGKDTAAFRGHA